MKIRRSIAVDPEVWAETQAKAVYLERSASWLVEKALRAHLKTIKTPKARKADVCELEKTADQCA
jgi:hypothetical protein